jgi:hypothetical protein
VGSVNWGHAYDAERWNMCLLQQDFRLLGAKFESSLQTL